MSFRKNLKIHKCLIARYRIKNSVIAWTKLVLLKSIIGQGEAYLGPLILVELLGTGGPWGGPVILSVTYQGTYQAPANSDRHIDIIDLYDTPWVSSKTKQNN